MLLDIDLSSLTMPQAIKYLTQRYLAMMDIKIITYEVRS